MKLRSLLGACALLTAVVLSGCSSASNMASQASSVASTLGVNPNLSTFMGLAQSGGIEKMLSGKNPVTLLAPSNDAIATALSPDMLANLAKPENKDQLVRLVQNHVIVGNQSLDQIVNMTGTNAPKSLTGNALDVAKNADGSLSIGGAKVTETMKTGNGFIHVIDKVLMPQ